MNLMRVLSQSLAVVVVGSSAVVYAGGGVVSPKPFQAHNCNSGIDGNRDCFEGGSGSSSSSSSGGWNQPNDNRFTPPAQVACAETFQARIVTDSHELLIAGYAVSGQVTSSGQTCNYRFNFLKATDKTNGSHPRLQIARLDGRWMHLIVGKRKFAINNTVMWEVPGFTSTELYQTISQEVLLKETVREYSENLVLVPNVD